MQKNMRKEEVIKHFDALNRYNQWEDKLPVMLGPAERISMVSNLYELIPKKNRQRKFNADGIIKMRQALSVLKGI